MKHGFGTNIWPDGSKYEGYYKDNKEHGQGILYDINGDMYEG